MTQQLPLCMHVISRHKRFPRMARLLKTDIEYALLKAEMIPAPKEPSDVESELSLDETADESMDIETEFLLDQIPKDQPEDVATEITFTEDTDEQTSDVQADFTPVEPLFIEEARLPDDIEVQTIAEEIPADDTPQEVVFESTIQQITEEEPFKEEAATATLAPSQQELADEELDNIVPDEPIESYTVPEVPDDHQEITDEATYTDMMEEFVTDEVVADISRQFQEEILIEQTVDDDDDEDITAEFSIEEKVEDISQTVSAEATLLESVGDQPTTENAELDVTLTQPQEQISDDQKPEEKPADKEVLEPVVPQDIVSQAIVETTLDEQLTFEEVETDISLSHDEPTGDVTGEITLETKMDDIPQQVATEVTFEQVNDLSRSENVKADFMLKQPQEEVSLEEIVEEVSSKKIEPIKDIIADITHEVTPDDICEAATAEAAYVETADEETTIEKVEADVPRQPDAESTGAKTTDEATFQAVIREQEVIDEVSADFILSKQAESIPEDVSAEATIGDEREVQPDDVVAADFALTNIPIEDSIEEVLEDVLDEEDLPITQDVDTEMTLIQPKEVIHDEHVPEEMSSQLIEPIVDVATEISVDGTQDNVLQEEPAEVALTNKEDVLLLEIEAGIPSHPEEQIAFTETYSQETVDTIVEQQETLDDTSAEPSIQAKTDDVPQDVEADITLEESSDEGEVIDVEADITLAEPQKEVFIEEQTRPHEDDFVEEILKDDKSEEVTTEISLVQTSDELLQDVEAEATLGELIDEQPVIEDAEADINIEQTEKKEIAPEIPEEAPIVPEKPTKDELLQVVLLDATILDHVEEAPISEDVEAEIVFTETQKEASPGEIIEEAQVFDVSSVISIQETADDVSEEVSAEATFREEIDEQSTTQDVEADIIFEQPKEDVAVEITFEEISDDAREHVTADTTVAEIPEEVVIDEEPAEEINLVKAPEAEILQAESIDVATDVSMKETENLPQDVLAALTLETTADEGDVCDVEADVILDQTQKEFSLEDISQAITIEDQLPRDISAVDIVLDEKPGDLFVDATVAKKTVAIDDLVDEIPMKPQEEIFDKSPDEESIESIVLEVDTSEDVATEMSIKEVPQDLLQDVLAEVTFTEDIDEVSSVEDVKGDFTITQQTHVKYTEDSKQIKEQVLTDIFFDGKVEFLQQEFTTDEISDKQPIIENIISDFTRDIPEVVLPDITPKDVEAKISLKDKDTSHDVSAAASFGEIIDEQPHIEDVQADFSFKQPQELTVDQPIIDELLSEEEFADEPITVDETSDEPIIEEIGLDTFVERPQRFITDDVVVTHRITEEVQVESPDDVSADLTLHPEQFDDRSVRSPSAEFIITEEPVEDVPHVQEEFTLQQVIMVYVGNVIGNKLI